MSGESLPAKRVSSLFIILVSIMLVLSMAALYQIFETYSKSRKLDLASVVLSSSAIALSTYMLLQTRRKPIKLGFEVPPVSTVIECTNCTYKVVRNFERGDYVFKEIRLCPKCNGMMIISSIYREAKKK